MRKRLFQHIFLASLLVLVLTVTVLFVVVGRSINNENRSHLRSEMELAVAALEAGNEGLSNLGCRIRLVDAEGRCRFDSEGRQAEFQPQAHPELAHALQTGEGWDTRASQEAAKREMSYARRLSDGTVLLVSDQVYSSFSLFLQMFTPLLILCLAILLLAVIMAHHGARALLAPLDQVDFSRPDERDVEEELKPLVRRLAEQNRQIRSQMEDLAREHARQDKYRREFTANVSHELKTPLTSISGFAELIRDGMVRPEDTARFAGKIHDESRRLMALVGDIIRLSRLDDGAMEPEKVPVCLQTLAAGVLEQLEPAAAAAEVTLQLQGEAGEVPAVPQMAEEILYNLCDNAIKYNRPGGSVTVQLEQTEQGTSVTVSDTGIGIPAEDVPRIFERFYRVDKSHSREVGGTGLGLSIVKHCAMYHHAEIHVSSRLGEGTAVTVRFPLGKETEA